jgi:hypothetical protein
MAEITLSNYVGFIFSEITRARDIADRHSRDIALVYAQDEILKNFSVPRFKIPKMDLTIPVLISGAKFSNVVSFVMTEEEFKTFVNAKINNAISTININKSGIKHDFTVLDINHILIDRPFKPFKPLPFGRSKPLKGATSEDSIDEFFKLLVTNQNATEPDNIIRVKWTQIFNQRIEENKLLEEYKKQNPSNELFNTTLNEVSEKIKASTIITQTKMENLLVNPETNVVKTGSSESTVFTIAAQITEEGIFIRAIKDEQTGKVEQIVEFE